MDYVVGSVAALISGNVTPNRPKFKKRALTPTKHQPSPNVTPKSELVEDRSIFLSPTLQRKKAIVKKSPKRIFENPDLDVTVESKSPKAEKVKKHLKDDLEAVNSLDGSIGSPNSSKNKGDISINELSSRKKGSKANLIEPSTKDIGISNDITPKKKKKQKAHEDIDETPNERGIDSNNSEKSPRKKNKKQKSIEINKNVETSKEDNHILNSEENVINYDKKSPQKNKKRKEKALKNPGVANKDVSDSANNNNNKKKKRQISFIRTDNSEGNTSEETTQRLTNEKKNNKQNKQSKSETINNHILKRDAEENQEPTNLQENEVSFNKKESKNKLQKKNKKSKKKGNNQNYINPNAITTKDSDSEHESDDNIESETEQSNEEALNIEPTEESSEEEEIKDKQQKKVTENRDHGNTEEEIKRTLFVGNVPFNKKCKKAIKKIFNKYGHIESVRIRNVPVKDARSTPKLAVIKNEIHPDRSTVNVYVKYSDPASVDQALVENNTILENHHLRVSRSDKTGVEHDPKCSIFVGNIPFALEDDMLREKFAKCGEIESVRIVRDKKTNAGKGFGYVNFKSKDGVELALTLTDEDLTIKNRIMRVKRCTNFTNKQSQRRQDGNNRFARGPHRDMNRRNQFNNPQGDGAYRRITEKRRKQDGGGDGPPNKRMKNNQPNVGKKNRKEFVGMTAEMKKKRKFNKGNKKKRVLSEILTK